MLFVLIGLGIVFLLGRSGIHLFWMGSVWPFILIVIGAALLVRHWEDITMRRRSLMGPAVLLTLGTLFTVQTMRHVNFGRTFPILLIVIGAVLVWQRSCGSARPSEPSRNEPPRSDPPSAPTSGAQLGSGAGSNPESEVKGS